MSYWIPFARNSTPLPKIPHPCDALVQQITLRRSVVVGECTFEATEATAPSAGVRRRLRRQRAAHRTCAPSAGSHRRTPALLDFHARSDQRNEKVLHAWRARSHCARFSRLRHFCAADFGLAAFICCPQQISEWACLQRTDRVSRRRAPHRTSRTHTDRQHFEP